MRTAMAIVNHFGEVVCELEARSDFFYGVPNDELCLFADLLMEGDTFRVEAIEVED